jgi:hypothetical protein
MWESEFHTHTKNIILYILIIVTRLRPGRPGFDSVQEIFFFFPLATATRPAVGST